MPLRVMLLLLLLAMLGLAGCGGAGPAPVSNDFTFAVIGDPHIGSRDDNDEFCMARSAAEPLLEAAVAQINARNVDFTIVIGDISNNGKWGQLLRAKEILRGLNAPLFAVPGNHDNHMSDDFQAYRHIFGKQRVEYSWLWKGFRFVTWHCINQPYEPPLASWSPQKIEAIRQDLQAQAEVPTFFMSHHQLYPYEPRDQPGEPWRHPAPEGSAQLREVLAQSDNVIMAIAGHVHRPRFHSENGLTAVTVGTALVYPAQIMLYNVSATQTQSQPMLIEDPDLLSQVYQLASPLLLPGIIGRPEDSEYTVIHRMQPGGLIPPATADESAE
ncbi:MAG: metallophosphoesterase family protein [Armatimonadota bacterium]